MNPEPDRLPTPPATPAPDYQPLPPETPQGRRGVETLAALFFGTLERRVEAVAIAAIVVFGLGIWAYSGVRDSLREMRSAGLQAVLDAEVAALELWSEYHLREVDARAADPDLRRAVAELARLAASGAPRDRLWSSPAQRRFRAAIDPMLARGRIALVNAIGPDGTILATQIEDYAGRHVGAELLADLQSVFSGQTRFVSPRPEAERVIDAPRIALDRPIVWFVAPVRDDRGRVIAALGHGSWADARFAGIVGLVRLGASGETYAFDRAGLMLSESRFVEELRQVGALPRSGGGGAALRVQVRDPGGDLLEGYRPSAEAAVRPLTRLARAAIAARAYSDPRERHGVLLDAYRNYRGALVVGAWRWLPAQDIGVAIEVGADEAYAPLRYLTTTTWVIVSLLVVAAALAVTSSFLVLRLRRDARRLGPYRLGAVIGEGAMSTVWRATHALLKRPTAIKILKRHLASDELVARFEREARLAARLSHPNTVEIYDYGLTRDGTFYYAMEYVEGITLQELVESDGAQSPARVAHILRQVGQSLREAHGKGLVHRDIKPHNVMLGVVGGEPDTVKVLDFGLVKEIQPTDTRDITQYATVLGTPLYMAPERLRDPADADARADIYALGVLGWTLLTGERMFSATNDLELRRAVLETEPLRPSLRAAGPIPPALEALVMRCLAKDREQRPGGADEVVERLGAVLREHRWRRDEAARWWQDRHAAKMASG